MRDGTSATADDKPVYRVLPVSAWYTFTRASNAPQLSAEEQGEVFEMMQRIGQRPTAASRLRAARGGGDMAAEGGVAGRGVSAMYGADEDEHAAAGGSYRTAMAASLRDSESHRKPGAHAGDASGGVDADGDAFDGVGDAGERFMTDVLDRIDGAGGGDDDGAGAGAGGGGDDGGDGRAFDLLGAEGDGDEVAIDYEPEIDDDAGDAGVQIGGDDFDGGAHGGHDADDAAQGELSVRTAEAVCIMALHEKTHSRTLRVRRPMRPAVSMSPTPCR